MMVLATEGWRVMERAPFNVVTPHHKSPSKYPTGPGAASINWD